METRLSQLGRFSPMKAVAVLSIVALVAAIMWQSASVWRITAEPTDTRVSIGHTGDTNYLDWQKALQNLEEASTTEGAATNVSLDDPDGLSNISGNVLGTLIGSYVTMKDAGTYTPSRGEGVAEAIATDLRANISYHTYSAKDLKTDPGTSTAKILSYRNDLRIALEPLLQNSSYELETFAYYLDTKDSKYLATLQSAAKNYRLARESAANVIVPKDGVVYHVSILNALSEFEAVIGQMATYADDPFASAALLRTFGNSESNMLMSFDALAGYFKAHTKT